MTAGAGGSVGATVVRTFRTGDIEAVERITAAAYGRPTSPRMRERAAIGGALLLVAEHAGAVAGVVGASDYGTAAYVASMAVDPALRRRGIARALMAAIVAALDARGIRAIVLDATDAGAPLYESFGFVDVDRTSIFERAASESQDASGVATRRGAPTSIGEADFERACELDRQIAGCDRRAVLRDLRLVPDAALVTAPDGYLLVRGDTLGPWLALGDDVAAELLARALHVRPNVTRAFVPDTNAAAAKLLAPHGFARMRTLRHMARGTSPFRRTAIYGQASLGHG